MSRRTRWVAGLLLAASIVLARPAGAWQHTIFSGANPPVVDAAHDVAVVPSSRAVIAAGTVDLFFGPLFTVTRLEPNRGGTVWQYFDFQSERGDARAVAATDDVIAAAGVVNTDDTGDDFAVVRLQPDFGFPLWRTTIGGEPSCNDHADAVAIDPSGDVVAAGTIGDSDFGQAFLVVKLDGTTGSELWRDEVPDGEALAVAVDGAGDVVAAGVIDGRFIVRKLDGNTGNTLWTTESGPGRAVAVGLDSDGEVYAAGDMTDACGPQPCGVVHISGSDGEILWRRAFLSPDAGGGEPKALVAGLAPGVVVAGRERSTFDTFAAVRFDADGSVAWRYAIAGDGDAQANDVALANDAAVVTGTFSAGTELAMAVARIDLADGEELWQRLVTGPEIGRNEGLAVAVDADDDVLSAGVLTAFNEDSVFGVVKLDGDTGDDFASLCGNDQLDPGEECDDANNDDGDCCSSSCTLDDAGVECGSDGNECTDDVCNGDGLCLHVAITVSCDDFDDCTENDTCNDGECFGSLAPIGTGCGTGNVCITGACNADGTCVGTANSDPCNDFNPCTTDDICGDGTCNGTPTSGTSCDDFNPCTGNGVCQSGICLPGPPQPSGTSCFSDFNDCTDDVCNGSGVCAHPFNTAPCDDGNVCTPGGVCNDGACVLGGTTSTTSSSTTTSTSTSTSTTTTSTTTTTTSTSSSTTLVTTTTSSSTTLPSTTSTSSTTTTSTTASSTTSTTTSTTSTSSTSSTSTTSTSSTTTSTVQACSIDGTCDDGDVCNGEESCEDGGCAPATRATCQRPDAEAYVTAFRADAVAVVDVGTRTVEATVTVAGSPWGVVWHPNGGRVYVTSRRTDTVSVIDTTTRAVVASARVGREPLGIAIDPAGARLWVANHGGDTVSVLDATTLATIATVRTGRGPAGIAVHPAGTRVYVSNYRGSSVSVIDAATTNVVDTIAVDELPLGIAVHPAGTKVYVTSYRARTVDVIGTTSATVLSTIRVGRKPVGVAFDGTGAQAFVASSGDDVLAVIDTAADRVTSKVPVGDLPLGVAVDVSSGQPWVTGAGSDDVAAVGDTTDQVPMPRTPVAFGSFIGRPAGRCPQQAPRCDDADPFTRDGCAAVQGCEHTPLLGLEGVAAGVRALTDTVAEAPLGDGPLAQRLRVEVPALGGVVAAVEAGGDRSAGRVAKRRLTQVVRLLERARTRNELGPDGGRLLDLARETRRRLKLALRAR